MFGLFNRKSAVDRHFEIIDLLRNEKREENIISLCKEDISIVEDFKREYVRKASKEADEMNLKGLKRKSYIALPPSYPSFKKLAIIYEKRKDYDSAISVCKSAIKAGYKNDGTEGGMKGRIEKLKAKQSKLKV